MTHYTAAEWASVLIIGFPIAFIIAYAVFELFCGKSCQQRIRRRGKW